MHQFIFLLFSQTWSSFQLGVARARAEQAAKPLLSLGEAMGANGHRNRMKPHRRTTCALQYGQVH